MTAGSLSDPAGPQPCLQHVTLNPGSQETLTCGAGFLRDLLLPAEETQACCPLCRQQGSCSLGGRWGRGGGTSDQQVLAMGDQDWWHLPDGAETASAGFPQKVLGPARYRWRSGASWTPQGAVITGLLLLAWSLPPDGAWPIPLSREQFTQDRRLAAGCQTPTLGHSCHHSLPHAQPRPMHHHFGYMTPGLGPCWPR